MFEETMASTPKTLWYVLCRSNTVERVPILLQDLFILEMALSRPRVFRIRIALPFDEVEDLIALAFMTHNALDGIHLQTLTNIVDSDSFG